GLAAALVESEAAREALEYYAASLEESEKPLIAVLPPGQAGGLPDPSQAEAWFSSPVFDHILVREPWKRSFTNAENPELSPGLLFTAFAEAARRLLVPGGGLVLLKSPPVLGERISRILSGPLAVKLREAEEAFFTAGYWTWTGETLEGAFSAAGFKTRLSVLDRREERLLTRRDIDRWFDKEKSAWGSRIAPLLGDGDFFTLRDMVRERAEQGPLLWQWKSLLLRAVKEKEPAGGK
ncbi:MAG: recombinase RarA, partial [Treponema sp.]|nr:recombinase RarA [Treponema sp.]